MRTFMVAVALGAIVMFVGPGQAGAAPPDEELRSLCRQVADRPPGGAELTTNPPKGAPLQAGQTVDVRMLWDRAEFDGPDVERVAHCVVTLDSRLRMDLSGSEAPSDNDGEYHGSFVMPAELAPGDCLCVLGVVAGNGSDGGGRRLGGDSCVTVTKPAPPTPPPAPPTTPVTTSQPDRRQTTVLPTTQTAPPALVPANTETRPVPLAELPRTGPFDPRVLLAMAGLALILGGGAITTRR
jgi:hypothetical protein